MKRFQMKNYHFSGIDGWGLSFANFRVTEVATDPERWLRAHDLRAWQERAGHGEVER